MVARSMQNCRGRNISGTYNVSAVFNNPNGKLTQAQQSVSIRLFRAWLKNRRLMAFGQFRPWSLIQLPNLNSIPKTAPRKPFSWQLIKTRVIHGSWPSNYEPRFELRSINLPTSQIWLTSAANENISHVTTFAAILGFVLSLLIIGVIFKSLIAPLISTLSMLMMYVVSLGLINKLTALVSHIPVSAITHVIADTRLRNAGSLLSL